MDKAPFQLFKPSDRIQPAELERCKEGKKRMPLNGVYRPILDRIALKQLLTPAFLPNPNLGVDNGEEYQPYSLSYYRKTPSTMQAVVLPNPVQISIEDLAPNFKGNPVQFNDFPSDFFVGNPLGGF